MFKFYAKWDVDTTAETLNVSLFGKTKKHRAKELAVPTSTDKTSKTISGILPDSDDEQYSKKDKKRLKKWKKKNKHNMKASGEETPNQNHVTNSLAAKKKIKTSDSTSSVSNHSNRSTSPIKAGLGFVNTKNKLKKTEKLENNGEKNRKRKHSKSESAENDHGPLETKKAKVEVSTNNSSTTDATTAPPILRKKRKRNRKKKNNSKKNKYKHLALNSKGKGEIESSGVINTETSKDVNLISNKTTNLTTQLSSNKSSEITSSRQSLNKNASLQTEILRKNTSNGSHSKNSFLNSGNESINIAITSIEGVEKEKSVIQKKKKKKKEKSPVNNLQSQPLGKSTDRKAHPQNLKPLVKNKLKKNMLLEMFNEPDRTANNNEDLTSVNKNLPGAASVSNKPGTNKQPKLKREFENCTNNEDDSVSTATRTLWGKASKLSQQAKDKLNSARFRYINEQLYSCTGNEALKMFRDDPHAFSVYHEGFENQVHKWPINPLNVFIKQFKDKPKNVVIADFGCGDAKLAQNVPQKVHSFDLVALNNRITVCDMSKTPLPGESVDVAVFCLSLMGTNISDCIREANRVLKTSGLLKIAEVVSRFRGLSSFTDAVCSHGFQLLNKRDLNQMFYLLDFKKIKSVKKSMSLPEIKLKPCIYKRR